MYQARLNALHRALQAHQIRLGGQHVLEVGCGTGFYTQECQRQKVASYVGVDITAVSVQNLARWYPEFRFLQADIADEVFPLREQFDLVLAADVLFHIVDDNRFQQAIANLCCCLKPRGILILSDLLSIRSIQVAPHCRFRSRAEYQKLLDRHGVTILHIEPIFAVLQPPVPVPGTPVYWHIYARVWHHGLLRLARWFWFDRLVPQMLGRLDEGLLLRHMSADAPNSKWLIAVNEKRRLTAQGDEG